MSAGEADRLLAGIRHDPDLATVHNGQFVLADLVALGEIGIKVALARENRTAIDHLLSADSKPEADGALDRAFVCNRQHARERDVHCARLSVGWRAERGRSAREHLRRGGELRVSLQSDDDFPIHCRIPAGSRLSHPVTRWYWCATFSIFASEK